jgi:hypothetical protein
MGTRAAANQLRADQRPDHFDRQQIARSICQAPQGAPVVPDDLQNAERDGQQCREYQWYEHQRRERPGEGNSASSEIQRQRQVPTDRGPHMRVDRANIAEIDPTKHQSAAVV